MTVRVSRRRFLGQITLAASATGLAVEGLWPRPAKAQVATLLGYLLGDQPLLAVVDLIEMGVHAGDPKISDVTARVDKLAQSLKNNFDDLQRDTRQIVKQELKLADLRRDTVELAALSYRLNIASSRGGDPSEVFGLSQQIDNIAYDLGAYGVAGSLAYLNAIALQNSVHKMLSSKPATIIKVNEVHDNRVGHIIYDGKDPDSLEAAIVAKRMSMADDPRNKNLQILKDRIGEWYNVGTVTRYFEASGVSSTAEVRYQYQGFQGGQPVVAHIANAPQRFSPDANVYRGRVVKATYTATGSQEALPVLVASDGVSLNAPNGWPSGKALADQINSIANEYSRFYDSAFGPVINVNTHVGFGMTPEHAQLRQYLIDTGLGGVKRILAVAYRDLSLA